MPGRGCFKELQDGESWRDRLRLPGWDGVAMNYWLRDLSPKWKWVKLMRSGQPRTVAYIQDRKEAKRLLKLLVDKVIVKRKLSVKKKGENSL